MPSILTKKGQEALYISQLSDATRQNNQEGFWPQADAYRAALEKATYAQLGPEYASGLNAVTNYLAGAGPLADSGARTALSNRLYSQILQRAQGQISGSYADYLKQMLAMRQQYRYQSELQKQQAKLSKKNFWDYAIPAATTAGAAAIGG